ncbi:MAG: nucleotidyltransferase domain-containing protein [Bacteroidota bacterium]|nr:nucleotidyltransferase domain-containing protein [Bacteroidota bacterium]
MYLDKFKIEINNLCRLNKVKSLYVFGSVLTEHFTEKSDIDLVVDIDISDPYDYADSYFNLKFALQDLFRRPIDLLENKAIKNPYIRQNIDRSKSLIYARQ